MDSSNEATMIMFNTYVTQFTCSHHVIITREKITTYLDAKENLNGLVSYVKNYPKPRLLISHAENFMRE